MRRSLNPAGLAAPAGPYALVTTVEAFGRLVFCAGAIALDEQGKIVGEGDIVAQTEQVMHNLGVALEAAGATFADVVKINNYVTDADLYPRIAPVRERYLSAPYPASTLIEVPRLLYPELLVEVEAIAVVDG
jgi:enamine deaminase RidA (YjgF/YER057c/UK114 family)